MTLTYLVRLNLFSMAAFSVTQLIAGTALAMVYWRLVRIAKNLEARDGANLLFVLPILPSGLAAFVVAALCVPAYLRFEPLASAETVNGVGLAGAALFLCIWGGSLWRASAVALQSWRF